MEPQDLKGIPTGKSDKCWLIRTSEALNGQGIAPPIPNPWYQSAVREIERLEAAVSVKAKEYESACDGHDALEKQVEELKKEAKLHAEAHGNECETLRAEVQDMEADVKKLKDEVETLKMVNDRGENEKIYLRGRIKTLLHQVASLSGILSDVSGKHADRINTGIPTPVHLLNR